MLLRHRHQIARTEHHCDYCGRTIQAGEMYVYQFSIFEGEPCPWKAHERCNDIAQAAVRQGTWDNGIPPFADWELEDVPPQHYDAFADACRHHTGRPWSEEQ